MSLAKVIEVLGEGSTMEEAIQNIVDQASKTVHNIKNVYIEDTQAIIENNQVDRFRPGGQTFLKQQKPRFRPNFCRSYPTVKM